MPVAEFPIFIGKGDALDVTVSIGVSKFSPGETLESLISRADAALNGAKEEGRNRVKTAWEAPHA